MLGSVLHPCWQEFDAVVGRLSTRSATSVNSSPSDVRLHRVRCWRRQGVPLIWHGAQARLSDRDANMRFDSFCVARWHT